MRNDADTHFIWINKGLLNCKNPVLCIFFAKCIPNTGFRGTSDPASFTNIDQHHSKCMHNKFHDFCSKCTFSVSFGVNTTFGTKGNKNVYFSTIESDNNINYKTSSGKVCKTLNEDISFDTVTSGFKNIKKKVTPSVYQQFNNFKLLHKGKGKGNRFIVLYPPKRSHDLLPLAGTVHRNHFNPPGDLPEQLAAYRAHDLSTV